MGNITVGVRGNDTQWHCGFNVREKPKPSATAIGGEKHTLEAILGVPATTTKGFGHHLEYEVLREGMVTFTTPLSIATYIYHAAVVV